MYLKKEDPDAYEKLLEGRRSGKLHRALLRQEDPREYIKGSFTYASMIPKPRSSTLKTKEEIKINPG